MRQIAGDVNIPQVAGDICATTEGTVHGHTTIIVGLSGGKGNFIGTLRC